MSLRIDGVYENGKVTLSEYPKGVRKAKVVVTFVGKRTQPRPTSRKVKRKPSGEMMYFGMFKLDRPIEQSDLKAAEWRGDSEAMDGK